MVEYIKRHIKKYPYIETMDIYKMIYQAVYLTGHIINDDAKKYLEEEARKLSDNKNELYEYISNEVVRINLFPFLNYFSIEELYQLFIKSNKQITEKDDEKIDKIFTEVLNSNIVENKVMNKLIVKTKELLPIHSNIYKKYYNPHYRLALANKMDCNLRILKLQLFINSLPKGKAIALEGRCASGKTTIAKGLENVTIIHCDDYFAKDDVLDFKRLSNDIDNCKELIKNKKSNKYKYLAYDCHNQKYIEKELIIKDYLLVEGVYGYSDKLRDKYDKLCFVVVSKDEQNKRLLTRGEDIYNKFINIWIPREEKYFENNKYVEIADALI